MESSEKESSGATIIPCHTNKQDDDICRCEDHGHTHTHTQHRHTSHAPVICIYDIMQQAAVTATAVYNSSAVAVDISTALHIFCLFTRIIQPPPYNMHRHVSGSWLQKTAVCKTPIHTYIPCNNFGRSDACYQAGNTGFGHPILLRNSTFGYSSNTTCGNLENRKPISNTKTAAVFVDFLLYSVHTLQFYTISKKKRPVSWWKGTRATRHKLQSK